MAVEPSPILPLPADAPDQVAAPSAGDIDPAPNWVPPAITAPPEGTTPPPVTTENDASNQMLPPTQTTNAHPEIINFTGVEVVGGLWRFTGRVIDEAPEGLTVNFGGEPDSLQGASATTDADGYFDKAILMNTDGSDNGLASAQTVDTAGLTSNLATDYILPG